MEQLNRIELRGNVGTIRVQTVGDTKVARFSLATNYFYKSRDGEPVIETTWHSINAWEGKNVSGLDSLKKGDMVHVSGRLRSQRYIGSDGNERTGFEVVANRVTLVEKGDNLQNEQQ